MFGISDGVFCIWDGIFGKLGNVVDIGNGVFDSNFAKSNYFRIQCEYFYTSSVNFIPPPAGRNIYIAIISQFHI